MERIIKFKAKRLSDGKWVEGDLYHNVRGFECCIGQQEKDDVYVYPVDPSTVCQYTGLKDMKGREIWENDNVTDFPFYGEVVFKNGAFIIKGKTYNESLSSFVDERECKRKRCANCKFFHLQREHKYLGNCGRNYLNTTCLDWEECKHWKPRQ